MKRLHLVLCLCFLILLSGCNKMSGHAYPRLGIWWLDPYTASTVDMARYDLLLDSFEDAHIKDKLNQVHLLNPSQINFKPLSPSERQLFKYDWESDRYNPNPEITHLPSDFFLLQTGALLTQSIDATTTVLYVDQMVDRLNQPLFHLEGEVAIGDYESAKIIAMDVAKKQLTVERGYIRSATAHEKGERIASHIRFWPGSWVMNVTDACPRLQVEVLNQPVNWIEYYFALITGAANGIYTYDSDNWDRITDITTYEGIIIDRFEDKESWLKWVHEDQEIILDLYHDFTEVPAEVFDASWEKGTTLLYQLLHEKYPDTVLIRNNPMTVRYTPYQGQVYETGGWTDPSESWWHNLVIARDPEEYYSGFAYLEWFQATNKTTPLVLFEVYEDEKGPGANSDGSYDNPFLKKDFKPNYQRMRFSLASALLGDGYYSYEINTNGHGALGLMWFDEYDNAGAGKGYLGFPSSKPEQLANGMYLRYFDNGLVLVNPTDHSLTYKLPTPYQKIKGTQAPDINTGEVVNQVTLNAFDGLILLSSQ